MADSAHCLLIEDLTFAWPGPSEFVLRVPQFQMSSGEAVMLKGPSGSGKTTLLSLICGITMPTTGRVEVAGTSLTALSSRQRDRFRADHIGVIFQQFNLLPFLTAQENVQLALAFSSRRAKRLGAGSAQEIGRILDQLEIARKDQLRPVQGLSVRQQQRVAACRAVIGAPDLIIADEPTSALDGQTEARFLDLLFAAVQATSASLLFVSHDDRLAKRFDRVVELADILQRNSLEGLGQ